MPNVTKRRGIYYFQRWVPEELRHIWPRKYIRESLGTSDPREANRKAAPLAAEWDERFQQARDGTYRRYQDDQLERIAIAWGSEYQTTIQGNRELHHEGFRGDPVSEDDRDYPVQSEAELDASLRSFLERLDWTDLGPQIEPEWTDYQRLRELVFEQHYYTYVVAQPRPLASIKSKPNPIKVDGPGFKETFESYLRERKPRAKTVDEFRKSVTDFLALHGGDVSISNLTKGQVVEYKNLLLEKPNAKNLSHKQRKLGLRELIDLYQGQDVPRLDNATVNKAMVPIHATLEYAVEQGLIESNPAQKVKAKGSKSTERKKDPYSADDLNRIFGSRIWTKPRKTWGHREWLPLLALFTGARLEELSQLFVSDVQEQEGIHYLNVAVIEEGQNVKNLSSIRRVPIHPALIKLGFLDFANRRKKSCDKMMFVLTPDRYGFYGASVTKWYGRQRKLFGIMSQKKTFHSFRHNFTDAGRDAEVDSKLVEALQGHADGSVSGSYGSGYSLKALDRAMRRIKYPGLNLDRIS